MMGIVSNIRGGEYEVVAVESETGIPVAGDCFRLEGVYCKEVVEKKRTVAITEIGGVQGMRQHPLYNSIPCEFYISAPIIAEGKIWGTVNYTSLEKRAAPFSAEDIAFIEMQAAEIGAAAGAGLLQKGLG